jgi:hypothetical protein
LHDRPDPLAATLTAIGCLSVIAARLVHHSEAVPAVMHIREAAEQWRAAPFVDLAAPPLGRSITRFIASIFGPALAKRTVSR